MLIIEKLLGDLSSATDAEVFPERKKGVDIKPAHPVELDVANISGLPGQSTNGDGVDCSRILVSLKTVKSKQKESPTKHSELLS